MIPYYEDLLKIVQTRLICPDGVPFHSSYIQWFDLIAICEELSKKEELRIKTELEKQTKKDTKELFREDKKELRLIDRAMKRLNK